MSAARNVVALLVGATIACFSSASAAAAGDGEVAANELKARFERTIEPFFESYCLRCHDAIDPEADLDLSRFSADALAPDDAHWALVLERVEAGDMPPAKAKRRPTLEARREIAAWIRAMRDREAQRTAGDPGPVLARRLSSAEYDYTIRDLTGADIRPARSFPIDPANQAGFDNSGESLTMSPALLKKVLQAARDVADHLALTPDGFSFAPHPVVADTDRDKWAVFRIVDFYRRQPTDYADYFQAAWRFQHRASLGNANGSLGDIAVASHISPKYLARIWSLLTEAGDEAGPIARLRKLWRELPSPDAAANDEMIRESCEAMRDYVTRLRSEIVPEVKNLTARPIQNGSQTLVMWKNRQMAANRRKFDPTALHTAEPSAVPTAARSDSSVVDAPAAPAATPAAVPPQETRSPTTTTSEPRTESPRGDNATNPASANPAQRRHVQAPTPDVVKRGGFALPPKLLTPESSATAKMAQSKKRGTDSDLIVPAEPLERARYEAAFTKFADLFPDAFYITERARVYMDAEKEQENAGRLLSAGLHSMTGYFRDDAPLYDLILDEDGQRELDRLWQEFDFLASIPQRMHTSFLWFERTDSSFMRDPEFDPYRPEDKSVLTQKKIRALSELYLAKAVRNNASEAAQRAITEHFEIVAANIARVEQQRLAAEPRHLQALEEFARRAFRRPLTASEREDLRAFYRTSRNENGLDHEEAMRDCVARILVSPHFYFRVDLLEAGGGRGANAAATSVSVANGVPIGAAPHPARPLSDYSLASRLSYFLWASLPDEELLQRAAAGELRESDQLRAQIRRMIRDPRARNFAVEFAGNWLDFRRFEQHNSVDRQRFPVFDDALRRAMFEEPIRFFLDVARSDRSVLDFLYATDTFVNESLAAHYGIPLEQADEDGWAHVTHAEQFGRGGLLPMGVFLTVNSPGLRTSPVKRGNWVVKRILGERIPPPPATVPELPADEAQLGELTLRQALAKHREVESCAACHARFDSLGLVFENYGPVGERRERDLGGRAVDIRAEFPNHTEGAGLAGLREYIRAYRQKDFVDNLCRKLLAYGLGRTLILSDEPLLSEMQTKLAAGGYRFSTLIESIVLSPQFLNKRSYEPIAQQSPHP